MVLGYKNAEIVEIAETAERAGCWLLGYASQDRARKRNLILMAAKC